MGSRRAACVLAMVVACRPFDAAPVIEAEDNGAADAGSDSAIDPASDPPASCKALLERDGSRRGADGVYEIDPDGPGGAPPIRVFCDLTLDDGGWTLVGRSAPIGATPPPRFGWNVATGSVDDEAKPYSLDVKSARIEFSEVLVGDQDRTHAYKFSVDPDFLTAHVGDTVSTGILTKVLGDCAASAGVPHMLAWAGQTALTDVFFLRDIPDDGQHRGLQAKGFDLAYDNCLQGGRLDGVQGFVLVR